MKPNELSRPLNLFLTLFLIFCSSGCTTSWKNKGSYYKTTQTLLSIESTPSGNVLVNNKYTGKTPISVPLTYEQEVAKKTRKVSYWITQPGWSLFVSILSFGLYLPFSAIPVDIETSLEPQPYYRNNEFFIDISSKGYHNWSNKLALRGEETFKIQTNLQKGGE